MLISVKVSKGPALKPILAVYNAFAMKQFLVIILLLLSSKLFGQTVNGTVKDAITKLPIANAQIISRTYNISTGNTGQFSLNELKVGDKIAIRLIGYETAELVISNQMFTDSVHVYLQQNVTLLKEIKVINRIYKVDSVKLRKEYTKVFAYKGPSFTDMFIKRDPGYRSPFAHVNPSSTASLLSVNLLQVFSLSGKKKGQTTKLKEMLIKDEERSYVDHLFSKNKISSLTGLTGDSLATFMNRYRPSIAALKKMTDYELNVYIKNSYKEFIKPQN